MSDMFPDIADDLSPREIRRREVIAKHGVQTRHTPDAQVKQWHAHTGTWHDDYKEFSVMGEFVNHARAQTEADAIETLATEWLGYDSEFRKIGGAQ